MNIVSTDQATRVLRANARQIVPIFSTALVFSFFINLLMFVSPLYMLQIYDRVVASRSEPTLIAITLLAASLMVVYGVLEGLRSRLLVRAGRIYDNAIAGPVFETIHRANVGRGASQNHCLRDVETLRSFLTGGALVSLCDLPWFPIFVLASFILHPWFGIIALIGSVLTLGLTLLTEILTRKPLYAATTASGKANQSAAAMFRNSEIVQALGMASAIKRLWLGDHEAHLHCQAIASDRAAVLVTVTKTLRMLLQIAILGTGAYLVIHQELSAGSIVAASILIGRALQPIESAVANWKGFIAARGAFNSLVMLFRMAGPKRERMSLPAPKGLVQVENLVTGVPGKPTAQILKGVSFVLAEGDMLGVIGPSAAGKSTLARALVGVWPTLLGTIRLDGNDLTHWDGEELGQHIGYLPQDVELFSGTVAQNISRFRDGDAEAVIEAARLAGCEEVIQSLSDGYNTHIGENGCALSGGQRQRIGLARALYGNPPLIVLDEPNASLDTDGEEALLNAMRVLKQRGCTIVLITHKLNVLSLVDKILVLQNGMCQAFGSRDEIIRKLASPRVVSAPTVVPAAEVA